MQKLAIERAGGSPVRGRAHVGAVASGNLEVLIEASPDAACHVHVETSAGGFTEIWRDVLQQGVTRHDIGGVRISINDGGATPAVVGLRLDQAILNSLEVP